MPDKAHKAKPTDEAKRYLSRAFLLKRLIASKNELINRLREQAESASVTLSLTKSAPTNKTGDIVGDAAAQIADLSVEILSAYNKLLTVQREIVDIIDRVERDNLRLVLEQRYLCGKKWEEIAVDNNYAYGYVHDLHRRALLVVLKLLRAKKEKDLTVSDCISQSNVL